MKVAVAGGTGLMGRRLAAALAAAEHDSVPLARGTGVDLVSGVGLAEALAGVDVVIDVSNITTTRKAVAVDFFAAVAANLAQVGRVTGVRHIVTLSIVGIDRVPLGYYQGKLRQEEVALAGPVPGTVLRATQFHEFAAQSLVRGLGPLVVVPKMLSQPVAAAEVAQHLVELAAGDAVGMAPELAGPHPEQMVDMVRRLVVAQGTGKKVLPVPIPGALGRAMSGGALLPSGVGPRGVESYQDWLDRTGGAL